MSEPVRTCVGCGRKRAQPELVRFAAPEGTLAADPERRVPGRGAYTCPSVACFERAVARRAFDRTLRRRVAVPAGFAPFAREG
jgi:uncharacterized protein